MDIPKDHQNGDYASLTSCLDHSREYTGVYSSFTGGQREGGHLIPRRLNHIGHTKSPFLFLLNDSTPGRPSPQRRESGDKRRSPPADSYC